MALIAVLAVITWVVRWWYQVDDWVPLFGVLATEPAHLPQYLILFALGVAAYRGDWLRRMQAHLGAIWLGVGMTLWPLARSIAIPGSQHVGDGDRHQPVRWG